MHLLGLVLGLVLSLVVRLGSAGPCAAQVHILPMASVISAPSSSFYRMIALIALFSMTLTSYCSGSLLLV